MKKYIKILAGLVVVLSTITSCKKTFLDEKVYSSFTPDALNDSLAFEASIVGIQNQYALWQTLGFSDVNSQGFLCVWQMGTDVAYNKATADLDPFAIPYTNYETLTSTDPSALFVWKWAYNLINNCNVVIANIETPSLVMSIGNKNYIKAEASYFRAVAYNTIATVFGKVPIITTPLTGPKTDFVRSALTEVNNLIIADLTFAKTNLPGINNVKLFQTKRLFARANKSMASQLLAEAYLRTGSNALAEAEADTVINSGDFSLTTARYGSKASQPGDAFADMFIYGNQRRSQGNREAIWVLEIENPNTVTGGAGMVTSPNFPRFQFAAPQHRRVWGSRYHQQAGMLLTDSLGGRGISRMALTPFVLNNLYDANDMRNSQYNIRRTYYYNNPASPLYGQKVDPNSPSVDTNRFIVPQTTKWNQFDPNDAFGFAMIKDIIIMRLGETYLLKAEAQFKQGNTSGAATTLNILRARANASAIAAGDVTLDFILDERVRELVAEENRRMTLMRTGTLVERATRGQKITGLSSKHLLLPIPKSEIELNKDAALEQNTGY
jgi:starch-binding outer membrane protein, SusD/RagB family